jgi:hypothetical protein
MMNDDTINDLDNISDLDNPSSPDAGVDYANEHERLYCTILFNSSVTRHGPSKIDEMSRLSRRFWESDETIFRFEKSL